MIPGEFIIDEGEIEFNKGLGKLELTPEFSSCFLKKAY